MKPPTPGPVSAPDADDRRPAAIRSRRPAMPPEKRAALEAALMRIIERRDSPGTIFAQGAARPSMRIHKSNTVAPPASPRARPR